MSKIATYYESVVDKFKVLHLITVDDQKKPMYHYISIGGQKQGCMTLEVNQTLKTSVTLEPVNSGTPIFHSIVKII